MTAVRPDLQGRRPRAFYRGLGCTEHAPVPDHWADGDDGVLFTVRL